MKNTLLILLLTMSVLRLFGQQTVKTGVYYSYRSYENGKPSMESGFELQPFVRVNKLDKNYNDTLFRLMVNGNEDRSAFAVSNGSHLFVNIEDSLYRKMEYIGRYPFVTITQKLHFDEGFVIVNRTPIWKEDREELFTYIAFVNKNGKLVAADFESMWSFLKGDNNLSKPFGKEKHVNETFRKYIIMMNERYPL